MENLELPAEEAAGLGVENREKDKTVTACANESGILEDISITGKEADAMDTSQEHHQDDTVNNSSGWGAADNSFSVGMKKDDSGIYSDKSANVTSCKEGSDIDFSESVSESLDDGNEPENKDNFCDLAVNENNHSEFSSKDEIPIQIDISTKAENEVAMKANTEKEADIDNNTDATNEKDGVNDDDSEVKEGASNNNCDNDEESRKKKEEYLANYVKRTIKANKSRSLVGYDVSDSDSGSGGSSNAVSQGKRRQYRKRRVDSDTESDEDKGSSASKTATNNDSSDVDSTPVLLRHSVLDEGESSTGARSGLISGSDSEEEDILDRKNDSSSESESEDTPMDVSEFGPPKHKWRAIFDLRQREFGYSAITEPGFFRKRVQGSLQMVQRFELQFKMDHHEGCVNALNFNSAGSLLASGSDDLNVVIWDWLRNRTALVYDSGHRSNVFQTKFMPYCGDCHVVSCARDGQVRLADLSQTGVCKGTKKVAQHKGAAHKLSVEMDSPHMVLSCGEDAVTFEIDLRLDKPNKLVTTKENDKKVPMYSIHSNPVNPNEFCLGGRDHFIRVYDKRKINEEVNEGLLKKYAPQHIMSCEKNDMKANVTCACYNYNGTEILGTYNDEDIYLFSNEQSDGANYIHRYRGHRNNQTVKGVNFYGPSSEFVVSGSDCGHIFLWDKDTENIVQFMEGDEGGVINVLEPHPFAPVLATSGLDHDVKIWSPTAEKPTSLKGLRRLTKRNLKDREDERISDRNMIDGSMLWFIMHHLRRGRRRREREMRAAAGGNLEEDLSDSMSEDEETASDNSDSDPGVQERIECNPS